MGWRLRLGAGLALAVMVAPGTWLRTDLSSRLPTDITVEQIAGEADTGTPGWRVGGVWDYRADNRYFGGFSALLTLSENRLRAFTDRGVRFTFGEPDLPGPQMGERPVVRQLVAPELAQDLWDIESATRDPATGNYWLGYEYLHSIHRFSVASDGTGFYRFGENVDWSTNSGAEAMERLSDGRFLVIGEGHVEALIYAGDPIEGAEPQRIAFSSPAPDHAVTDVAELPDGRILLLMRAVVWAAPPFASLIAIGEAPEAGMKGAWSPQVALRFDGILPSDNYEAIAVRALEDGTVAVWVMADDNFSVQQRNLLVKLLFDPAA
ncbi:MAG: esterase-like activity of phytase family protein [Erythrobacter sp.]